MRGLKVHLTSAADKTLAHQPVAVHGGGVALAVNHRWPERNLQRYGIALATSAEVCDSQGRQP